MNDHERLARAYGGLLRLHPRRYRIHRRDEMLSTLLDGAAPDRRLPTFRESADLVIGGLRCHFQLPRGVAYQLVAVLVALTVGLVLAAAATWLAWLAAPDRIGMAPATAIARTAFPLEPAEPPVAYENPTVLAFDSDRDSRSMATAADLPRIEFHYDSADVAEAIAMLADARARLTADGWHADHLEENSASGFWAARGESRIWVGYYAVVDSQGPRRGVVVAVHGLLPTLVPPAALAGLMLGLTGGWLWAGWAQRRYRRHVPAARACIAIIGWPLLLLATLIAVTTIGYAMAAWVSADLSHTGAVRVAAAMLRSLPALALLVAGLLMLSVVAARAPRTPERGQPFTPEHVLRYGARTVAAVHLLIAAGYGTIVLWYLATLRATGGDRVGMANNAYDPNDWIPLGGHPLNPMRWLLVPAELCFILGWLLSPALLAATLSLLVIARRSLGRGTRALLLVAALTAVALPILTFSQIGSDVGGWLLD